MGARVIYIAGWGRSGSTLLDTALGSLEGFTSTGELRFLWSRGLQQGRTCGCGRAVPDCEHWRAVLAHLGGYPRPDGGLDPSAVVRDQRAAARTRHTLALLHGPERPAATRLRSLLARLYPAVADVGGGGVVVDSSKMPADAALAATTRGVEVHLVHLVRDPRAVAWSWQRPKVMTDLAEPRPIGPHSPLVSTTRWLWWNLLIQRVARRAASSTVVRYEDLVADPAATLRSIVATVGADPAPVDGVVRDGRIHLVASHTVSGNPDRFRRGPVPIRADDAWRSEQGRAHRAVATAVALPLLRRHGYPVTVRREPDSSGC